MTRIHHSLLILATAFTAFGQGSPTTAGDPAAQQPVNVLFVNIDDMNDWTQMMGTNPQIQTPQMERLAEMGTYFTNAHSQYARCVQSRSSYMSGLYPPHFDGHEVKTAQAVTEHSEKIGVRLLDLYFKDHGYKLYMAGKIYHSPGRFPDADDSPGEKGGSAGRPPEGERNFRGKGTGTDWYVYDESVSDADMGDYQIASWTIEQIQNHPKDAGPFFAAVGFRLPHVPWYIPKKWADLYPADETLWKEPFYPEDMDDVPSLGQRKVLRGYPDIANPESEFYVGEQGWREIVQAYAGSVSFIDDQIGRLIDGLAASPYAENTVIVVFSDHGYHLGNKNIFTKHNLWDRSTQVPLFFAGPGVPKGRMIDTQVELVDVYPTLIDLAGLPPNPMNDGDDLGPLMKNPDMTWDKPARSFHSRNWQQAVIMGDWRYIEYADRDHQWELYNTENDPYERHNLAGDPQFQGTLEAMRALKLPLEKE